MSAPQKDHNKHHASREWLHERIAAVVTIPLLVWLVINLVLSHSGKYGDFQYFLSSRLNAGLLIVFIGSFLYYTTLAMKVVFEDYIHNIKLRDGLVCLMKYAGIAAFLLGAYSIITIYLKG